MKALKAFAKYFNKNIHTPRVTYAYPPWDAAHLKVDEASYERISQEIGDYYESSADIVLPTVTEKAPKVKPIKEVQRPMKKRYLVPYGISQAERRTIEVAPLLALRLILQLFSPFAVQLREDKSPLRYGFNSLHNEITQLPFPQFCKNVQSEQKGSKQLGKERNAKTPPTAYEYILNVLNGVWKSMETTDISSAALIEQICILISYAVLKFPIDPEFASELSSTLSHVLAMRFGFANSQFQTRIAETIFALRRIATLPGKADPVKVIATSSKKWRLSELLLDIDITVSSTQGDVTADEYSAKEAIVLVAYEATEFNRVVKNITRKNIIDLYKSLKNMEFFESRNDILEIEVAAAYLYKEIDEKTMKYPNAPIDWFRLGSYNKERFESPGIAHYLAEVDPHPNPVDVAGYLKSKVRTVFSGVVPYGVCDFIMQISNIRNEKSDGLYRLPGYNPEELIKTILQLHSGRLQIMKIVSDIITRIAEVSSNEIMDVNGCIAQIAKVVVVNGYPDYQMTFEMRNDFINWNQIWGDIITQKEKFLELKSFV